MLWDAGQQRTGRESRDRLAERFFAARDAALDAMVATGQAKPMNGVWRLPAYARAAAPEPLRSPAERDLALASLGARFPGMVRIN